MTKNKGTNHRNKYPKESEFEQIMKKMGVKFITVNAEEEKAKKDQKTKHTKRNVR